MKRKNRNPSASTTSPDGKKKKVASENAGEPSTAATKFIDFTSPKRVVESLLSSTNLESFFDEHWEKKPHFVKRENADFYGSLFSKKDLEAVLKKEEIQFIEDVCVSRYAEGKTELLNEDGRVNLKHIKASGVAVQFNQPDRFKVCIDLYCFGEARVNMKRRDPSISVLKFYSVKTVPTCTSVSLQLTAVKTEEDKMGHYHLCESTKKRVRILYEKTSQTKKNIYIKKR